MLAFQPTFYDIGNSCSMDEAGNTVITAEVKGGDTSVTKTNETACQVELHIHISNTNFIMW